ncbi:hypothetical protein DPMN_131727 [Dreissena polymorpha]|uniref:Uncharacterized protein n=1 Tax=Dreissena polymorpha TaxID=45954 RepID=A0A9D4J882_DREPO|nr:hypothetical protein DPMN_131727 [Dreissena polymorpha]
MDRWGRYNRSPIGVTLAKTRTSGNRTCSRLLEQCMSLSTLVHFDAGPGAEYPGEFNVSAEGHVHGRRNLCSPFDELLADGLWFAPDVN